MTSSSGPTPSPRAPGAAQRSPSSARQRRATRPSANRSSNVFDTEPVVSQPESSTSRTACFSRSVIDGRANGRKSFGVFVTAARRAIGSLGSLSPDRWVGPRRRPDGGRFWRQSTRDPRGWGAGRVTVQDGADDGLRSGSRRACRTPIPEVGDDHRMLSILADRSPRTSVMSRSESRGSVGRLTISAHAASATGADPLM